ncbi:hypothetical protein Hanom_Chr06g00506941 [Helianthus anomalus]
MSRKNNHSRPYGCVCGGTIIVWSLHVVGLSSPDRLCDVLTGRNPSSSFRRRLRSNRVALSITRLIIIAIIKTIFIKTCLLLFEPI